MVKILDLKKGKTVHQKGDYGFTFKVMMFQGFNQMIKINMQKKKKKMQYLILKIKMTTLKRVNKGMNLKVSTEGFLLKAASREA